MRELLCDARLPRLIALAELERALPVLARELAPVANGTLDDEQRAALRRHAQVAEFRMLHLESRLGETLDRLQVRGVHPVLLKGAAVAATVFGSFAERPMGDLDILIEPADAAHALEAAREAGWTAVLAEGEAQIYDEHHHLPPLRDGTGAGFALELHTELLSPRNPFGLTAADVRARAVEQTIGGRTVLVPSPADQVLHACLHFAWGHMLRAGAWRTFRDVEALLRTDIVGWAEIAALAHATRAASCVYWTLRLGVTGGVIRVPSLLLRELSPALPSAALAGLERHLLAQLLPSEVGCPSVRLQRLLWSMAIQPRRSGHGGARPWDRAARWEEFEGRSDGAGERGRIPLSGWARYARAVTGI